MLTLPLTTDDLRKRFETEISVMLLSGALNALHRQSGNALDLIPSSPYDPGNPPEDVREAVTEAVVYRAMRRLAVGLRVNGGILESRMVNAALVGIQACKAAVAPLAEELAKQYADEISASLGGETKAPLTTILEKFGPASTKKGKP